MLMNEPYMKSIAAETFINDCAMQSGNHQ
jgi:hypothetical protein